MPKPKGFGQDGHKATPDVRAPDVVVRIFAERARRVNVSLPVPPGFAVSAQRQSL
jgi:hypothetical protein